MNFATLLDGVQNDFLTSVLPVLRYVLFFIIIACAIVIIITILMQANNSSEGMDVISGSQESYYAQNKGSSRDGKLKIITIVMSCIAFVCIVLYFVTELINRVG